MGSVGGEDHVCGTVVYPYFDGGWTRVRGTTNKLPENHPWLNMNTDTRRFFWIQHFDSANKQTSTKTRRAI